MKAILTTIAVLFLTGCGNMEMSGRSDTGDMGSSGYLERTGITSGFDPNNPYHGG
jgi:hypothetical protein